MVLRRSGSDDLDRSRGEGRGSAPATMNCRVAATLGLFEDAVMCGEVEVNPVPAPRRSSGLRARRRGLLGHVGPRRPAGPARLVRQDRPLPESLDADDVAVFLADLDTHRDRAMTLAMLLGGLRVSEVRTLRLAEVDMGMRQVKVTGKGVKQRLIPIDRAFFTEVRAYLRPGTTQGPARGRRRCRAPTARRGHPHDDPPGPIGRGGAAAWRTA